MTERAPAIEDYAVIGARLAELRKEQEAALCQCIKAMLSDGTDYIASTTGCPLHGGPS